MNRISAEVVAAAWVDALVAEQQPLLGAPVIDTLPNIAEWAEEHFFIIETRRPIELLPHQKRILRLFTEQQDDGRFKWTTLLFSTVKKSGKTAISAMYARWAAETWGAYQEVYNLGNKLEQAKDRAFKTAKRSIEMAPDDVKKQWDLQQTIMTHLPSGSIIKALPIGGAGEAGGNQSLTVWTELWGFEYDEALLMWAELKPVLTRPLSQRFVDTYAGFEGISTLLKGLWESGLAGERLDDELPIYGNEAAGLIAYIDQGEAARRMPWQQGDRGRKYYAEQAVSEDPLNYTRHHLNEWVTSQDQLIQMPLWDRLVDEKRHERKGKIDVVLGVDAAVSGDCNALVVVTYDHDLGAVVELETYIWEPPKGGKLDYSETIEPTIRDTFKRYRVVCVAYDPYQLHDMMTRLEKDRETRTDYYAFPQGNERALADTNLVSRIRQGTLAHSGNAALREHVQNADGKAVGDSGIRIVKRVADKHVDGVVALSMGAWKCYELLGQRPQSPVVRTKVSYGWQKRNRSMPSS